MIGAAALLLVAPGASLVNAEPAGPALPADLVAAIQRDLGLTPVQYLDQAETGQKLASFADSIRATFPKSFAGAWLDASGTPLVGLADGPDKAAARTAVEVAGYQVKDQSRSERTLLDELGQLTGWIRNLPAEMSGRVTGAAIDPVANDIALNVKDVADGSSLQPPDFLQFVRVVLGQALGSSDPSTTTPPTTKPTTPPTTTKPTTPPTTTKPTTPPTTTPAASSTIAISPVTGATVGKITTLVAKVNPAAAGGTVTFEDDKNSYEEQPVGADGTARMEWSPETAGKVTVKAIFSGRDGVAGSTTTQQVTVAQGGTTTTPPKPPADAILGGTSYDTGTWDCSFGFNGVDGNGGVVNISAGHCVPDPAHPGDSDVAEGGLLVGTFDKTVVDGGDYTVIKINDNAAHRFENNFINTYGKDPLQITGTANPVVGAPVCKSGMSTGFTCGKITAINQDMSNELVTMKDSFVSKLCSLRGDSGGPIVTGTKALGIASAATLGECNGSSRAWAQPINSILADNPGMKVRTN
ncbi:Ig-like domain repeat protein [Nocardia tengchongensis]|uniref:Ig-like domain repeat protein n=1 Tax=Nocardia tengchongensis TaxID=2055889 RepID=UPI00364C3CB0